MAIDKNKQEARTKLIGLLNWSDRIGSDEIHEINEVIMLLKDDN